MVGMAVMRCHNAALLVSICVSTMAAILSGCSLLGAYSTIIPLSNLAEKSVQLSLKYGVDEVLTVVLRHPCFMAWVVRLSALPCMLTADGCRWLLILNRSCERLRSSCVAWG